jgi:polyhydroxyalkanoate synthase subunit PhaC
MDPFAISSQLGRDLGAIASDALRQASGLDRLYPRPALMPTPKDVIAREGTASLLRFVGSGPRRGRPILLVPSLINQWYVLDLRAGASLVTALVDAGLDVYCLDWGAPEAEDRFRTWDDVLARLDRMVRRTMRSANAQAVALLGYCMGGTLATIYSALFPERVVGLVDLAGPIDFSHGGMLRTMVDRRWFDADAIAAAGNVSPEQMQSGFGALRPTLEIGKWVALPDLATDPAALAGFRALDAWASDNIPFPAAAYRTYIGELYQDNRLVAGTHRALGRSVTLRAIQCPTAVVVADRDTICPPAAATALLDHVGTSDRTTMRVPGGHVGAVVGGRAARELYPALCQWLDARVSAA